MRTRREIEAELGQKKPDHVIHTTLKTEYATLNNVICKFYLPKKITDPVYLSFKPSAEGRAIGPLHEMKVQGEVENAGRLTTFHADHVYTLAQAQTHWVASNIVEHTLIAEAWDLEICHLFDPPGHLTSPITYAAFALSPSRLLEPSLMIERRYTGEVKVETNRVCTLSLANGPTLSFKKHFRYEDLPWGECLSFPELVAEFEEPVDTREFSKLVDELDDVLLLASLAERHSSVCLGWTTNRGEASHSRFFRRGIAVPKETKANTNQYMIHPIEFQEYLRKSYSSFVASPNKKGLRQAIQLILSAGDNTIEAGFLKLFIALETLVSWFKEKERLEPILETKEQWEQLRTALQHLLREHDSLKDSPTKRELVYQKLPELNRVAFGTAFRLCIESLANAGLNVSDLWPVVGHERGTPLADLRNKLSHGVLFTPPQISALIGAQMHLRWCVERMILALLGWPIEKSNVSREKLSCTYFDYHKLEESQGAFASR